MLIEPNDDFDMDQGRQDFEDLVGEYKTAAFASPQDRRDHELELWHRWNDGGRQREHLEPILDRFRPFVNKKLSSWSFQTVPKHVIETELWHHIDKGIQTYNPNKGAALSTHVFNIAQGAVRLPTDHMSAARLPEGKARKIAPILSAQNELKEVLGRDPTHAEIADHSGVSQKHVTAILKGMRKNAIGSTFESDPTPSYQPRDIEILDLMPDKIRHELGHRQAEVFEYIHGLNGKPRVSSSGEIARLMGKNPSQISRDITAVQKIYVESAR